MVTEPALTLYRGHTVHQRSAPFTHRFKYGLSLINLDIDRLAEANAQSWLFAIDKPALFSFRRKDHGDRTGDSLRNWAETLLAGADIKAPGGPIRLLTFPRHWFYKFAPISVWLLYDDGGVARAIIYEVNNTFGDTHCYAAEIPDAAQLQQHESDKVFHVSPFFDVSGRYRFKLRIGEDDFRLVVETLKSGQQTHMATISAKAKKASSAAFLKLALIKPFSSLMVTAAIHWQALKLWIKGAKYHARPTPPNTSVTRAK